MKLSEYEGEQALDILADLIEPATAIMGDKKIADAFRGGKSIASIVKLAIKEHKKEVIECLAVLDGEDPSTYKVGILTLPAKLLELMNDPELKKFFTLQGQTEATDSSGSATATTEANAQ